MVEERLRTLCGEAELQLVEEDGLRARWNAGVGRAQGDSQSAAASNQQFVCDRQARSAHLVCRRESKKYAPHPSFSSSSRRKACSPRSARRKEPRAAAFNSRFLLARTELRRSFADGLSCSTHSSAPSLAHPPEQDAPRSS